MVGQDAQHNRGRFLESCKCNDGQLGYGFLSEPPFSKPDLEPSGPSTIEPDDPSFNIKRALGHSL